MKKLHSILTILTLSLAGISFAQAHAFLDYAEPKVGETLAVSPTVVKIWFTERVKGALSKIQVFNPAGEEVDGKDAKVDPTERSLMSVSVPKLPAGTYKVVWNAIAVDTHHTTGTFTFTVTGP